MVYKVLTYKTFHGYYRKVKYMLLIERYEMTNKMINTKTFL